MNNKTKTSKKKIIFVATLTIIMAVMSLMCIRPNVETINKATYTSRNANNEKD